MKELREFAQHKGDFDQLHTRILAISVDDQTGARTAYNDAAMKQFSVLSDPSAKVVRTYGLLHPDGHDGADIALRTAILVDEQGNQRWRRMSSNVVEIPSSDEILKRIRETQ